MSPVNQFFIYIHTDCKANLFGLRIPRIPFCVKQCQDENYILERMNEANFKMGFAVPFLFFLLPDSDFIFFTTLFVFEGCLEILYSIGCGSDDIDGKEHLEI